VGSKGGERGLMELLVRSGRWRWWRRNGVVVRVVVFVRSSARLIVSIRRAREGKGLGEKVLRAKERVIGEDSVAVRTAVGSGEGGLMQMRCRVRVMVMRDARDPLRGCRRRRVQVKVEFGIGDGVRAEHLHELDPETLVLDFLLEEAVEHVTRSGRPSFSHEEEAFAALVAAAAGRVRDVAARSRNGDGRIALGEGQRKLKGSRINGKRSEQTLRSLKSGDEKQEKGQKKD
jgi:hypothetical protein